MRQVFVGFAKTFMLGSCPEENGLLAKCTYSDMRVYLLQYMIYYENIGRARLDKNLFICAMPLSEGSLSYGKRYLFLSVVWKMPT